MKDVLVLGALVVGFAAAMTFHIALVVGLAHRIGPARGFIALVIPPLAPYWGFGVRMRVRSVAWIVSVVIYIVARLTA
jgi:hypothetical protein